MSSEFTYRKSQPHYRISDEMMSEIATRLCFQGSVTSNNSAVTFTSSTGTANIYRGLSAPANKNDIWVYIGSDEVGLGLIRVYDEEAQRWVDANGNADVILKVKSSTSNLIVVEENEISLSAEQLTPVLRPSKQEGNILSYLNGLYLGQNDLISVVQNLMYPVGSVVTLANSSLSPEEVLGFGEYQPAGQYRELYFWERVKWKAALGHILPIVAEAARYNLTHHRDTVVAMVNRIRNTWYNLEDDYGLFGQRECVVNLETHYDVSNHAYVGFTCPGSMRAITAAWLNQEPLKLFSKWYEWREGINQGNVSPDLRRVNGEYVTLSSLDPCLAVNGIAIQAVSPSDKQKELKLRLNGEVESVKLNQDLIWIQKPVVSLEAVQLPMDLKGQVVFKLMQEDGSVAHEISRYNPDETLPRYFRYKADGMHPGQQITIRGQVNFFKVFEDFDLVETANEEAWRSAALYIIKKDAAGLDQTTQAEAQLRLGEMLSHLLGDYRKTINLFDDDGFKGFGELSTKCRLKTKRRKPYF